MSFSFLALLGKTLPAQLPMVAYSINTAVCHELVHQTVTHTPTPFVLLQCFIHTFPVVMVIPLPSPHLLPAFGPLWTVNAYDSRSPCVPPLDKIGLLCPSRPHLVPLHCCWGMLIGQGRPFVLDFRCSQSQMSLVYPLCIAPVPQVALSLVLPIRNGPLHFPSLHCSWVALTTQAPSVY